MPTEDGRKTIVLLCLFAVSGVLDAITFLTYGAFVAAQTGNMVLLPIALVAHVPALDWRSSALSIAGFILGATVGGRLARAKDGASVWERSMRPALLIEAILVAVAALPAWRMHDQVWGPALVVAILGAGVGVQASLAYAVRHRSMNTVVITGALSALSATSPLGSRDRQWHANAWPILAMALGAGLGALTVVQHMPVAISLGAVAVALLALTLAVRRPRSTSDAR